MYDKGFSRLIILLALGMHIQQGSVRLETRGHGCLAGFVGAADAESDGAPPSPVEPPEAKLDDVAPAPAPAEGGLEDVVRELRRNATDYKQACDFIRNNTEQYPKDVKVCGFVDCCVKDPLSDPKSTGEDCFLELVAQLIVDNVNIQSNCKSAKPTYSTSDCEFVSCCVDANKTRGDNLENMGKDCYDRIYNPAGSASSPAATSPSTLTTLILYGLNMVTLVYFL